MNCYLSVETLVIASDKCPDLYLSIGRSIYWEEKGFSDNRGKTSIGTRNQRNLVVFEDVYLKISNKMSSLFFRRNCWTCWQYNKEHFRFFLIDVFRVNCN